MPNKNIIQNGFLKRLRLERYNIDEINTLTQLGYNLANTVEFTDHQAFSATELHRLSGEHPLVMTEKDAVKCRDFAESHWWYLPVNAKLTPEFDHALLSQLQQVAQTKKGLSHGI